MSINQIPFYQNPILASQSIYDEEELTALELAGKTAGIVNDLSTRVDAFESNNTNYETDISNLDLRVDAVESTNITQGSNIAILNSEKLEMNDLLDSTGKFLTYLGGNELASSSKGVSNITNLEGGQAVQDINISNLGIRVTNVETLNTTQTSDINALGGRLTIAESDINAIESVNITQGSNITNLQTRVTNIETSRLKKVVGYIGNGLLSSFNFIHNLNTTDFTFSCFKLGISELVYPTVKIIDANTINIEFSFILSTNEYAFIFMGV